MAERNDSKTPGNGVAEAIEEAASEKLGVEPWDRPAIFRDAATAATDNALPFWAVLALSGGIATLGAALDSSAVVIGAMLVAPLLAPVVGLALALAVGDGRLAVQAGVVVVVSTLLVLAVSALLTVSLPFHTVTVEMLSRTRPSTIDLVIAVFSGLVAAVVTVGRGSRMSAAIPGVAIAVALIPPLAVAGFGIGVGRGDLIYGSLLLYGANLAGIVLSGMLVFLLVGMHGPEVLDAAKRWHDTDESRGLAGRAGRLRWIRTLGVFRSPWARSGLVLAFVVALGIPLWESLQQITRETRVDRAIAEMEEQIFNRPGTASVLSKEVVVGAESSEVYLRVATSEWFGEDSREAFERGASTRAGEPVSLQLEQLPTGGEGGVDLLRPSPAPIAAQPTTPMPFSELVSSAQRRLDEALESVILPSEVRIETARLTVEAFAGPTVVVVYMADEPLGPAAAEMLRRQVAQAVELPELTVRLEQALPETEESADTAGALTP